MQHLSYGFEQSVMICSDTPGGLARCAANVEQLGARVAQRLPIAGAAELLETLPPADAALVEVCGEADGALDRLLAYLNLAATSGVHASVVIVPPELLDIVAAGTSHEGVALLCAPSEADRIVALGLSLATPLPMVLEERGDDPPLQLRRLSEEVGRIARTLAALSSVERGETAMLPDRDMPPTEEPPAASVIRSVIRARRLRDRFFSAELFADPAWDMLLDLMLARVEGRAVAVSSLCIAAAVPPTTALRWIKRLTDEGIFLRIADPRDGRRVFIELSDGAVQAITSYFRSTARFSPYPG